MWLSLILAMNPTTSILKYRSISSSNVTCDPYSSRSVGISSRTCTDSLLGSLLTNHIADRSLRHALLLSLVEFLIDITTLTAE